MHNCRKKAHLSVKNTEPSVKPAFAAFLRRTQSNANSRGTERNRKQRARTSACAFASDDEGICPAE